MNSFYISDSVEPTKEKKSLKINQIKGVRPEQCNGCTGCCENDLQYLLERHMLRRLRLVFLNLSVLLGPHSSSVRKKMEYIHLNLLLHVINTESRKDSLNHDLMALQVLN
jgi:hypothetical protein